MTAPAPPAPVEHGALARELLRRALQVLPEVPPAERGPVLAAIDEFLAAPGPVSYLSATRVLIEALEDGGANAVVNDLDAVRGVLTAQHGQRSLCLFEAPRLHEGQAFAVLRIRFIGIRRGWSEQCGTNESST